MHANIKAVLLQLTLLIGFLIFARGFLPPTRTKLGFSTHKIDVAVPFKRLVFMVVDAMRSDFVFSEESNMLEVHDLLRNGYGYAFTAYSDPPTVTLPRLKGLTTGASANFLDAVINIAESDSASTLENQDSWIAQMHTANRTMHLYGDDTWLNLFPGKFNKHDGTASFYVADFTEVDNNVTRHLATELQPTSAENDWDVLVLHYLGLDHIGHKGGPKSRYMPEKQQEMSKIAHQIFQSLDNDTLLVMLGDHGMNDVGNHGGASDGETSAAMALFSKQFSNPIAAPLPTDTSYSYYSRIKQVDLVPSLAALLGIPVPKNSLGVLINDLLPLWSFEDQKKLLKSSCAHLELPENEQCTWENLKSQQQLLMRTSSQHLLPFMYAGVALLVGVAVLALKSASDMVRADVKVWKLSSISLVGWWVIMPVVYFAGMMGSSTVEEEHYIWFWLLSGVLIIMLVSSVGSKDVYPVLGLIICYRFMRGWNSPGQKWAALPDAADFISRNSNLRLLGLTSTFAFIIRDKRSLKRPLLLIGAISFVVFKISAEHSPVGVPYMVLIARIGFACTFIEAVLNQCREEALTLICVMQTRTENLPLWIFFVMARQALVKLRVEARNSPTRLIALALIGFCFEYMAFFSIGGSNSLASVDLSNAYNGVSNYNVAVVALLTYLGNWGPTLYFSSIYFVPYQRLLRVWFYGTALISVTLACLILRHHLFIWTVFSPKLLYVGAWLVIHEILATNICHFINRR